MKFGSYLKQIREEKKWTQPLAAERADIEQSYLSKLETSKSYPGEDVFDRLVETYEIDIDEMTRSIDAAELQKLKEVKTVRLAILEQHRRVVSTSRKWMIAGVFGLCLAGAFIGAAFIPATIDRQYLYRSEGILKPNEPLDAFKDLQSEDQNRRSEMLGRLDQVDVNLDVDRGQNFVENSAEGRRFYNYITFSDTQNQSFTRYFLIPGLMFLLGSIGCFFNVFNWKR